MKIRGEYTCPLELTHDMIKGKWKPVLLWQLNKGGCSLAGLKRSVQGISQKMLIQHLKELMDCGLVQKWTGEGYPLKSEYTLTARGKKTFEAISILQDIGIEMMREDGREDLLREKGLL